MYRYFSSIRHGRGSSLFSLLSPKPSLPSNDAFCSRRFLLLSINDGHVRGFSSMDWSSRGRHPSQNDIGNANAHRGRENVNFRSDFWQDRENVNSRRENVNFRSGLMQDRESMNSRRENVNLRSGFMQDRENMNSRREDVNFRSGFMQDRENVNSRSENDDETGRTSRPMDFVRGIIEDDGKDFVRRSLFSHFDKYQYENDADIVHIKMLHNNTFVTITDPKGNVKLSGSAGSVKDLKAGQKLSRYAAEATAEVVGRRARGLGLKSVVMKVNGFTHFRRKRQAILSWRDGFTDSRWDRNPIVHIEDTTRKPHYGCRLPKKRRI